MIRSQLCAARLHVSFNLQWSFAIPFTITEPFATYGPRMMIVNPFLKRALLSLTALSAVISLSAVSSDVEQSPQLSDAFQIYQRSKLEDLKLTSDPNEIGERLTFRMLSGLVADKRFEDLFNIGDEAFEKESDVRFGKGVGPIAADGSTPSRLLTEVGGMDSGSCRACHFKGGPDGSGTSSGIAMLRSDGSHIATATLRDSPHVMGLGYIQMIAQEITEELKDIANRAKNHAITSAKPATRSLNAKNISFGSITAMPDGSFDTTEVRHIRDDLVVRPFGHKGRAASLFEFVDEALQMHHGIQTNSRLEQLKGKTALVGNGPEWDPDNDGYQAESSETRSLLIAAYLSMLPVPSIIPPKSSTLAVAWGNGQRSFEEIGCASCHVPELRFKSKSISHEVPGYPHLSVTIPLPEQGQSPAPAIVDRVFDDDSVLITGTPIYPFTDLRLHDMGAGLADKRNEPSVDGDYEIDKSLWLTRSLWGLADTAPYLHDGRATTVEEAIMWHGGEALDARQRFAQLSDNEKRSILVYLASLTRDPTALIE